MVALMQLYHQIVISGIPAFYSQLKAIIKQRRRKPPHSSKLLLSHQRRKQYYRIFPRQPTSSLQMIIKRNKENAKLVNKIRCYKTKGKFESNNCQKYLYTTRRKKFTVKHHSSRKRASSFRGLNKTSSKYYQPKSSSKPSLPARPPRKSHAMILAEALSPKVGTQLTPGFV